MSYHDALEFVRGALPEPPARVLEVGAGRGELAVALRELGYDVLAIDPATDTADVVRLALHEVDEPAGSFDVAVAVLSLHHVNPLAESCERLAELIRPEGRLVIDEFDVDRLDERAARWWIEQGGQRDDPAGVVAEMRAHLHPLARLREELARGFVLGPVVRGAYLYRWNLPPEARRAEEEVIAAGRIPATGARFLGTRS